MEELNVGILKDDNNKACVRKIVEFVQYSDVVMRESLPAQVLHKLPDLMSAHLERVSFKPGGLTSMASFSELIA